MGNNIKSKQNTNIIWQNGEKLILEKSYELAKNNVSLEGNLHKTQLKDHFARILDANSSEFLIKFLYNPTVQYKENNHIDFIRYIEPLTIFEKRDKTAQIDFIVQSLPGIIKETDKVDVTEVIKFVTAVVIVYKKVLPFYCKTFSLWQCCGYMYGKEAAEGLANAILHNFIQNCTSSVDSDAISQYLYNGSAIFQTILRQIIAFLYGYRSTDRVEMLINEDLEALLPVLEGLGGSPSYVPILELPHIIFLRDNLPYDVRDKWRFLFSSKLMGESFSTMLGKILNCGPTLLIVEDEDHHIFAAYAPDSWLLSPNFSGNATALLFTLTPYMRCFGASGYNDHYQYLNLNQQTMPNGLGMGGQFNYWGLWLDCEYGKGHSSETCSTFRDYTQLSKQKEFRIRNLEVWGLGDERQQNDDSDAELDEDGKRNKRSVLDKNLEDRVMLELSGRKIHSDGFRDNI